MFCNVDLQHDDKHHTANHHDRHSRINIVDIKGTVRGKESQIERSDVQSHIDLRRSDLQISGLPIPLNCNLTFE
jgi:hypothetical protein